MNVTDFDAEEESGNDDRRRWNDAVLNDDMILVLEEYLAFGAIVSVMSVMKVFLFLTNNSTRLTVILRSNKM